MPSPRTGAPEDDYYALLGIDAGADDASLRRAWRRLASRYHPDRAGHDATATFQRLSAAYAVLSDPLARAAYDRRHRRAGQPAAAKRPHADSAPSAAPATMIERLCGSLNVLLACGAARIDDDEDVVTLVLRRDEAARGGMIMIAARVDVWCPACADENPQAAARCTRCGGTRTVNELFSAWLAVRPGAKSGDVLTPSAELPRMIEPLRFRILLAGQ